MARAPRTTRAPAAPAEEAFDFEPAPRARRAAVRPKRVQRRPREVVLKEKREKFKEIMAPRAKRAIHDIRLLTYGSNRKRYHYTPDDIELLRSRLHEEVDQALAAYTVPPGVGDPADLDFRD